MRLAQFTAAYADGLLRTLLFGAPLSASSGMTAARASATDRTDRPRAKRLVTERRA